MPACDQLTTLSKFLCPGVTLEQVTGSSTANAAKIPDRPELGSLKPGSVGGAAIASMDKGGFVYTVPCVNHTRVNLNLTLKSL